MMYALAASYELRATFRFESLLILLTVIVVVIFFFGSFFFCEIVDNVNTD